MCVLVRRYIECPYRFIPGSVRLAEPNKRSGIIHHYSAAIWCHLERLRSILTIYMNHLCTLRLLVIVAILIPIPCIATILISIRHISIGHIAHLLILY